MFIYSEQVTDKGYETYLVIHRANTAWEPVIWFDEYLAASPQDAIYQATNNHGPDVDVSLAEWISE